MSGRASAILLTAAVDSAAVLSVAGALTTAAALTVAAALALPAATARAADDPSKAGAYCPFPAKGEKPACFAPVEKKYSAFFAAAGEGEIDDAQVTALQEELTSAGSGEDGYLAISSLAYGYFRLAELAASAPDPDPALVARLNGLNELLSSVYEDSDAAPGLRNAVRAAAEDLHARAPAVQTECGPGADGESCRTTDTLLSALKAIDDPSTDTGVRGALGKLFERVTGPDDPPLSMPTGNTSP